MDIIHNPFTNAFVAAWHRAPIRIIAGSGAGGLVIVAQKEFRHQEHGRFRRRQGQGRQGRHHALQHLRDDALSQSGKHDLTYSDYNIIWFNDTLSMASAFEAKAVDLVTHVEPFATRSSMARRHPLASNLDVWGPHGPDA